jgi:SanA protein
VRRGLTVLALSLLGIAATATLLLFALRAQVVHRYEPQIYHHVDQVPTHPAAIVFGAGYWPSGTLSNILADRMETAVALYKAGRVRKLLLSGDNRVVDYNEPERMAEYALARDVPRQDIVLDYAGRRTYDSCYRAGAIFGLQEAVLVTQAYHLPRALFTCDRLGISVSGVSADRRQYIYQRWYSLRDLLALGRAWVDVTLLRPLPVLGEPIAVQWE